LLLVEDNVVLGNSLTRGLSEDGFVVDAVSTGADALRSLERRDIDGVVLDLGLPDMDGLAVLDSARARGIHAPILVLTARDDVKSRVGALDRGADDYLVKPFEYDELLARLRALLRRAAAPRWAPRSCNGLVLRDDELAVTIDDQRIGLSPREHALLGFFLRRQGEALGRAEILLQVFGYGFEPGTNLVNVHIANLRRKLGSHAVVIETVRGIGYRLRAAEPHDG
jgi:two-component system OmpR family response regulator